MLSNSQHPAQSDRIPLKKLLLTAFFQFSVILSSVITGLLLGFNSSAQAQAEFGNFGITTPSERFRQEGQDRIEQEIHRLQSPPDPDKLLIIGDRVDIQEELMQFEDPRWYPQTNPEDDRLPSSMDGNW